MDRRSARAAHDSRLARVKQIRHGTQVFADPRDEEEVTKRYETYADSLLVEIVTIGDDRRTPNDEAVVWLETGGLCVPAGWVETNVLESLGAEGVHDAFFLDHQRRLTEWGASGAFESVIITLAEGLLVESAIRIAVHFARRVSTYMNEDDARQMSEEEAVEWARFRIGVKYGVETSNLRLAHVSQDEGGGNSVGIVDGAGTRYELRLRGAGAGVVVAECLRIPISTI